MFKRWKGVGGNFLPLVGPMPLYPSSEPEHKDVRRRLAKPGPKAAKQDCEAQRDGYQPSPPAPQTWGVRQHYLLPLLVLCTLILHTHATPLLDWRTPYALQLDRAGLLHSSPSGMFWDDLRADTLFGPRFWPDTAWRSRSHLHLEPWVGAAGSTQRYADGKTWFGKGALTTDARWMNIFVRDVLDVDTRYTGDPSYAWKQDRGLAGRISEAYVQAQWKHGFLRLGRMNRNWGPFPDRSLILSATPPTYDALEWQITGPVFEFRHLFAHFPYASSGIDTRLFPGDSTSQRANRYLTAHSLNVMFGQWASAGITESVLFTNRNGFPDFQYVNPVAVYFVTNTNAESDGNLMIALQAMAHPLTMDVTLRAQVMIDDIQVDNETQADQEPGHWGGDFGVYWKTPTRLPGTLSLEYRYLSRWLYLVSNGNTAAGGRYTYLGRSLGAESTDLDRWQLGFSMIGTGFWTARAGAAYQRRGGNAVTSPWNTDRGDNGYRTERSLQSDSTEHTIEASLNGMGYIGRFADLSAGFTGRWVRNSGNVRSGSFTFEPQVGVSLTLHYPDLFLTLPGTGETGGKRQ